jgi:hypothetical protein
MDIVAQILSEEPGRTEQEEYQISDLPSALQPADSGDRKHVTLYPGNYADEFTTQSGGGIEIEIPINVSVTILPGAIVEYTENYRNQKFESGNVTYEGDVVEATDGSGDPKHPLSPDQSSTVGAGDVESGEAYFRYKAPEFTGHVENISDLNLASDWAFKQDFERSLWFARSTDQQNTEPFPVPFENVVEFGAGEKIDITVSELSGTPDEGPNVLIDHSDIVTSGQYVEELNPQDPETRFFVNNEDTSRVIQNLEIDDGHVTNVDSLEIVESVEAVDDGLEVSSPEGTNNRGNIKIQHNTDGREVDKTALNVSDTGFPAGDGFVVEEIFTDGQGHVTDVDYQPNVTDLTDGFLVKTEHLGPSDPGTYEIAHQTIDIEGSPQNSGVTVIQSVRPFVTGSNDETGHIDRVETTDIVGSESINTAVDANGDIEIDLDAQAAFDDVHQGLNAPGDDTDDATFINNIEFDDPGHVTSISSQAVVESLSTGTDLNVSQSTGDVTVSIQSLSQFSTDDLSEGSTNLYFTDERAQDAVGGILGEAFVYDDPADKILKKTSFATRSIGQSSSDLTLDASEHRVFEFEPTADIGVDITGLPTGRKTRTYLAIKNGGQQNVTFKADGQEGKWNWVDGTRPNLGTPTTTGSTFDLNNYSTTGNAGAVGTTYARNALSIRWGPNGNTLFTPLVDEFNFDATTSGEYVELYDAPSPYDITNLSSSGNRLDMSGQVGDSGVSPITDLAFNDDGTKVYVSDSAQGQVVSFSLNSAYGSNGSIANTVDTTSSPPGGSSHTVTPRGVEFGDSGSVLIVSGVDGGTGVINSYALGTPYDISTIQSSKQADVSANELDPTTPRFNASGTKLFVGGEGSGGTPTVTSFTLSAPYDISTLAFENSLATGTGEVTGIDFTPNGSELHVLDITGSPNFDNESITEFGASTSTVPSIDIISAHQRSGEVYAEVAGLNGKTTNQLPEGPDNLYFTEQRAKDATGASVQGGTDINTSYDSGSGTLTIDHADTGGASGNNTSDTFVENITFDGRGHVDSIVSSAVDSTTSSSLLLDSDGTDPILLEADSDELKVQNQGGGQFRDVRVRNLVVEGSETILNTQTVETVDNEITLNSNTTGSPTENAGLVVERGNPTNASLIWNETGDYWAAGLDGSENQIVTQDQLGTNITGGTDINTSFSGGTATIDHADTGAADSTNTLPTVIRTVTTDGRGHVETLETGTFTGGTDINVSGSTIEHADTGADDFSGANGEVVNDIETDGRGHVDTIGSIDLDTRYYTETEADNRFVNVSGDTMNGALTLDSTLEFTTGTSVNSITTSLADPGDDDTLATEAAIRNAISLATPNVLAGTDINITTGTNSKTVNHADTGAASSTGNSGGVVLQTIDSDGRGHLTSVGTVDLDPRFVNESGDSMSGDLTFTGGVDDSFNNQVARNIIFDSDAPANTEGNNGDVWMDFGDPTSDVVTSISGGTSITVTQNTGAVTVSHGMTGGATSTSNSNGSVVQDISFDMRGHATSVQSTDLDNRYYTQSSADGNFVNESGDTVTGQLNVEGRLVQGGGPTGIETFAGIMSSEGSGDGQSAILSSVQDQTKAGFHTRNQGIGHGYEFTSQDFGNFTRFLFRGRDDGPTASFYDIIQTEMGDSTGDIVTKIHDNVGSGGIKSFGSVVFGSDVDINDALQTNSLNFSGGTSVNSITTSLGNPGDDSTLATEAAIRSAVSGAASAGVTSLSGGTDISVSSSTGSVTVNHANTGAADSTNTLPTVIRGVITDGRGHVDSINTGTFTGGTDIDVSGSTISHANTGAADSTNSGATVIQSAQSDGRGHLTSFSTTDVVGSISGGTDITVSSATGDPVTVNHGNTGSAQSTGNTGGTVIQDINTDGNGHVTGVSENNLDGRFLQTSGDTMGGALKINSSLELSTGTSVTGIRTDVRSSSNANDGRLVTEEGIREAVDNAAAAGVTSISGGTDISVSSNTGSVTVNHANTGGATDNNTNDTFIENITFDGRGHVESVTSSAVDSTTSSTLLLNSDATDPVLLNVDTGELQLRNQANTEYRDLRVRNLVVEGTETIFDTQTVSVTDNAITLNSDATGTPSADANIVVERGASTDARLTWNESGDYWAAGLAGSERQIVTQDQLETRITGGTDITTSFSSGVVTVDHANTGAASSTGNSNGTVIQTVDSDGRGHLTSVGTTDLDNRYYTQSEVDGGFVSESGDTINGNLTVTSFDFGGTSVNSITTSVGNPGSDSTLATEQAIREAVDNAGGDVSSVSGGTDINVSSTTGSVTVNHDNTSSQGDVSASIGGAIDEIDLDGNGHVTNINTVDFDGRFVNESGDTMTGTLDVNNSGDAYSIQTESDIRSEADVIASYTSDLRHKTNVKTVESALDKIDQINGIRYDWNDEFRRSGTEYGLPAQEVQKVLPEAVTERNDGSLALDYKQVIPLLTNAIKELREENRRQSEIIDKLHDQIK